MTKRWGFTYIFCNDLAKMKWFYTEILHLDLIWDSTNTLAFKIGDHQLSIDFHEYYTPFASGFSIQPGWQGGTEPRISWSLECDKEDFIQIVHSATRHEIPTYYHIPKWNGYWSFPILDPMNHTIEITCTEKSINV
ncbi:VOC family protein [Robertmurraya massiliosenegalensis]|uniref:hypothetical protein n=1 Tax=Robertmurraya TaxID=2837507 RepID=UPI0039A4C33D